MADKEENLDDLVKDKKEEVIESESSKEKVRQAEKSEKQKILDEIKEEKRLETVGDDEQMGNKVEFSAKNMGLVKAGSRKKSTFSDIFFRKQFHPIWLILILGALAGGLVYALQYYGSLPNKVESSQAVVKKQFEQSLMEASDSAGEKQEDVKTLNVQILNGTGVKGQAGKVKTIISDLGMEKIEVGNADDLTQKETAALFSKKVGDKTRESVMNKLKEIFETVSYHEASADSKFDIQITTGTEK